MIKQGDRVILTDAFVVAALLANTREMSEHELKSQGFVAGAVTTSTLCGSHRGGPVTHTPSTLVGYTCS